MTTSRDREIRALARELNRLKQAQANSKAPQLGNSSVEAGVIQHKDVAGNLTTSWGVQYDGTVTTIEVNGPPPPAPAGLTAEGAQISATATWDGSLEDALVVPLDFARCEVHASRDGEDFGIDFLPGTETRVSSIETASGGTVSWTTAPGDLWIKLVLWTNSGKYSEPSPAVKVTVLDVVDAADIAALDQHLGELETSLGDAQHNIDQAQADLTQAQHDLYEPGGTVDLVKSTLTGQIAAGDADTLTAAAAAAQTKADAAKSAAISAAAADAQAKATAAQAAATQAAATDAAQKAQAAQDAAEAAAQAYADTVAAGASQDAIDAAAADAQAKADAAKQAAIDAASADATAKADAAQAAATSAAAADATTKANNAKQAAIDALSPALAQAQSKATDALTAAQAAQATADGAIRTYYQDDAPWPDGSAQPDDVLGDMWFNQSTGQAYRWNGTSWQVIEDQTIGQALAAAQGAQATADGKITAFYQGTQPTDVESDLNDLWFNTSDGNKPRYCSSTSTTPHTWSLVQDGSIAAGDAAVQAAAAADAKSKADAAQAAATAAAATTAQQKADAAQAAALAAAKTYAEAQASGASADALAAAKADAQTKADAAKDAAISAAAADAKAKADAAQAAATATAAADATAKANAAQAASAPRVTSNGSGKTFYNVMMFAPSVGTQTGNLVIQTPIEAKNYMTTISITGYNYHQPNTGIECQATFYAYAGAPGSGPSFPNPGFNNMGSMPITARYGYSADGKVAIILHSNDTNNSWYYPSIAVSSATLRQAIPPDSYVSGWSASFVSDADVLTNYTALVSAPNYDAGGAAATAASKADAAQTTASGKNQILSGTTDPVGVGKAAGDIWQKYTLTNNVMRIVATWRWDGSAWKSQALDETYLPQVNIGTGTYGELDGLRLKAKSVQASTVVVEGSIGNILLANGVIKAEKLDVNDVTAAVAKIIKLDVSQLVVTGSAAINAAVIDKLFVETFAAKKITGNEIDAAKVAAAVGSFVKINASQILTSDLTATISITTGKLIAGNAEVGDGIQTFTTDIDGNRVPSTQLGVPGSPDALTIGDVASISSEGDIAGTTVASDGDISVAGTPLVGKILDPEAPAGIMDQLSRGGQVYTLRNLPAISATISQSTNGPIGQIDIILPPGRLMEMKLPWRVNPSKQSGTSPAELLWGVRAFWQYTTDGSEPPTPGTSAAELFADSSERTPVGGGAGKSGIMTAEVNTLGAQFTTRVKILFIVFTSAGTQLTPSLFSPFDWYVYFHDRGPAATVLDAGTPGTGSAKQFTTTWTATDSRTWGGTGATYGAANADLMYHGVSAAAGLTHAAVVFNGAATSGDEKGKTMQAALTGATVLKVEIGIQSIKWKDGTGELNLQKYTGTTIPSTDGTSAASTQVRKPYTTNSQWQWTTDPVMTSWIGPTNRGIYVGPPTWQGSSTYGAFASAYYSNTLLRPQCRVTYTRTP